MQPNYGFGGSEAPKPCILRWFGGSETCFFGLESEKPGILRGFVAFCARKSLSGGLREASEASGGALEAPEAARRLPIGAEAEF